MSEAKSVSASAFLGSIGINTHSGFAGGAYQNSSLVVDSLNYIGVSTVRDAYVSTGASAPVVEALAAAGIKFDFVVSSLLPERGDVALASYIQNLTSFVAKYNGSVVSIEGLNEANLHAFSYNGSSSMEAAASFQKLLYEAVKGTADLSHIPVLNLTIGNENVSDYASLGDLTAYSDYANVHSYTHTSGSLDATMENAIALAQAASSGDPVVITEAGYTTLESFNYLGVSETAQAKLILDTLLNAVDNGASQTYLYELFDGNSSETAGDSEAHFGLFNDDGTPKLAAVALHNLNAILSYQDAGNGAAGGVSYDLANMPSDSHALTMTKANGIYDIVIWTDALVWDDKTDTDIVNAPKDVTVSFGSVQKTVYVYDPLTGKTPIAVYHNVSSITVPLSDSPLIIEVGAINPVTSTTITVDAHLTMTASELVASLSTLADSTGLEHITLEGSSVLEISSVSTMKYIIANYGHILAKIDGDFSFAYTWTQDSWKETQAYDSAGKLLSTIDYAYANGVLSSKEVVNTDGSSTTYTYKNGTVSTLTEVSTDGSSKYSAYNITGHTFTTLVQTADGNGKTVSIVRSHADGSLDYTEAFKADGSKVYGYYNAAGKKITGVTVEADGSRITTNYDTKTGFVTREVDVEPNGDKLTTIYSNGVKTSMVVSHADGTTEYHAFNLTGRTYTAQVQTTDKAGKVISIIRSHTDGSLDYTETLKADGSKVYGYYNAAGKKITGVTVEADGSRTTTSYDAKTGLVTREVDAETNGDKLTTLYANGVKTSMVVSHADGTTEYHAFNLTGRTYTSQVQTTDKAGKVISIVRSHADGSLDYTETLKTDGTKVYGYYNAAGKKITGVTIEADGSRITASYDAKTGVVTKIVDAEPNGDTLTTVYTAGVKTSMVVAHANGTTEYYAYNITGRTYTSQVQTADKDGKIISIVRSHADGSLDYTETLKTDGTKVYGYYNAAGQKITAVTAETDGSRITTSYDAKTGIITKEVDAEPNGDTLTTVYTAGVKTSMVVAHANGSTEYYAYNITGRTYTAQVQTTDKDGKVISIVRSHADGSLDYTETLKTDGTKLASYYDATGQKTMDVVAEADGDTTTTSYTKGIRTSVLEKHADGSSVASAFNVSGQSYTTQVQVFDKNGNIVSLIRSHADGSLDYAETVNADGSKTYSYFDATGHKLNAITVLTNGERTATYYDAASGNVTKIIVQETDGDTATTSYTNGIKTGYALLHADGSAEYHAFNLKGLSYTTQVQIADKSGKIVSIVRSHADGSLDYSEVLQSDGSKAFDYYDAQGRHLSSNHTFTDGSKSATYYDATTGYITKELVQITGGDTTTTTYSAGVKSSMSVAHADGSADYYAYNLTGRSYTTQHQTVDASGVTVSVIRSHADGSLDYTEVLQSDGSKVVNAYDATGNPLTKTTNFADGSREIITHMQDGTGDVRDADYNSAKVLQTLDVLHTDGTHTAWAYTDGLNVAGGAGDDTFYFYADNQTLKFSGGADKVYSFDVTAPTIDHIAIDHSLAAGFADLTITQSGYDTVVAIDAHNSIRLVGVQASALSSDAFLFV